MSRSHTLVTMPSVPSRADEQRRQVVRRDVLARRPAEADELARRDDRLQAGDPRAGDAVLERVRPAGVRRDVAADRRRLRGARVGRVQQAALARQARDVGGQHAGLDLHPPQQRVELADAPSAARVDTTTDRRLGRHRAARVARAAAARDDRHVALVAPGDDRGDLLGACPGGRAARRRGRAPRGDARVLDLRRARPASTCSAPTIAPRSSRTGAHGSGDAGARWTSDPCCPPTPAPCSRVRGCATATHFLTGEPAARATTCSPRPRSGRRSRRSGSSARPARASSSACSSTATLAGYVVARARSSAAAFQSCYLGYAIDRDHTGRGLATAAIARRASSTRGRSGCTASRRTSRRRTTRRWRPSRRTASATRARRCATCTSAARGPTTTMFAKTVEER